MGNRAVLTTATAAGYCEDAQGVYLHWNGGRDSVEAFLKYCELQGFRSPEFDPAYGWARFTQIVSNFFGGDGLSIGIGKTKDLDCDNGDNGLYIVKDWKITGRRFFDGKEQDTYPLKDMLLAIDEKQPAFMQIRAKILEMFDNARIILDITGDPEEGYRVVEIRILDNGERRYKSLYNDSDYDKCADWMNDYAQRNDFPINEKSGKLEKTA